jgi:hypothetical protein
MKRMSRQEFVGCDKPWRISFRVSQNPFCGGRSTAGSWEQRGGIRPRSCPVLWPMSCSRSFVRVAKKVEHADESSETSAVAVSEGSSFQG